MPSKPKTESLEARARRDPALLRRALADPGLRAKLPDSMLTPALRAQRKDNRFVSNIGDVTRPLTGRTLVDVADSLVDREFAPQEDSIGRQERQTGAERDAQQTWAKKYYGDQAGLLGGLVSGQGTANTNWVQALRASEKERTGAVDKASAEAGQRAQGDASVRGEGLDGGGLADLAARAAEHKLRASEQAQTQQGAAQTAGEAAAAILRGTAAATAQQGGEVQGSIGTAAGNRLSALADERAKLRGDRKGTLTDTLLKLRGQEGERYLTERGLSNDAEKARLDARARMTEAKSQADVEAAKAAYQDALTRDGWDREDARAEADREFKRGENRLDRESRERTSTGGRSATDLGKAAEDRDGAISLAQRALAAKGKGARADTLALLTEKYGSTFARVAVGAVFDGGAKSHLDQVLYQRFGIHIPRKYRTK